MLDYTVNPLTHLQRAAAATGNGASLAVGMNSSVVAQITGTFVGTITWEGTLNGSTWKAILAKSLNSGTSATTTTATDIVLIQTPRLQKIRARVSAYTSGTITVIAAPTMIVAPDIMASGSTTLQAGTAYAAKVRLTDSSNNGVLDTDGAQYVAQYGAAITLKASATITTDTTTASTPVTGLGKYKMLTALLAISAKTWHDGATLDVYVQMSPDAGTTWIDIIAFPQITNADMANGKYMVFVKANESQPMSAAINDGALAAGSVESFDFCDRLRTKVISAGTNGTTDTITVAMVGYVK